eukprot:TRINITY_DN18737_c0_g1_i1.p1 TRINITY_DN18737_c0_g1~~TRINITY_DN18737_c0_g1_i1.p1  ORF type:complete len:183 (+),score=21.62 TRINITY_DN18737_c0_g1_i1:206-754(+)
MMLLAVLLVIVRAAATNSCCGSASCQADSQHCSKSECLQGPVPGSWNCGTFRGDGVDDDCLFLSDSSCSKSHHLGSLCVDLDGREGYCEEIPEGGRGSRWPSWLARGQQRVCARSLAGEGRCLGASKVSGEMLPDTRRNYIAETKRQRAREQEAYIERLVSLLKRRDEPRATGESGDASVMM